MIVVSKSFFARLSMLGMLVMWNSIAFSNDACVDLNIDMHRDKQLMKDLKVAAVQYPIKGDRTLPEFLTATDGYIREAHSKGAELVVLPELTVLDLLSSKSGISEQAQLAKIAKEVTPKLIEHYAELSKRLNVAILAGSAPREVVGGIVNTAILVFPNGRRILQDKIFLTPDEVRWQWQPGDAVQVFDTPWGRTSILICYDCEIPLLSSMIAKSTPEVILIPSMTGIDGLKRVSAGAAIRAVEHHAYVVLTGTVEGQLKRTDFCGQAGVYTPCSTGFPGLAAQGPSNQPAVLVHNLNMALLRRSRSNPDVIYPARDQLKRQKPIKLEVDSSN